VANRRWLDRVKRAALKSKPAALSVEQAAEFRVEQSQFCVVMPTSLAQAAVICVIAKPLVLMQHKMPIFCFYASIMKLSRP
jgi:hypothetical protein